MRTQTVGEILRRERESRRVSVVELAKLTKVRVEYLNALEDNNFSQLPSAAFAKMYIRTYGQILGFDHGPLLALLRRDFKESSQGKLLSRDRVSPISNKHRIFVPKLNLLLLLLAVIGTLAGYIMVQFFQAQQPPMLKIASPANGESVAPQLQIIGSTNPQAIVSVNDQAVAIKEDGSFATQIYLPREGLHIISVKSVDARGKINEQKLTVRVVY